MTTLRAQQRGFADAVWEAEAITPESAGMAAYRRSVRANLAFALQASYPVIGRIVGSAFLAEAARAYVEAVPSRSGDLNHYGDQFDQFLAGYAPAASLPYLPDVATLEWQVQSVLSAAEAPAQDVSQLAQTPPEQWPELFFALDPAHALLASDWPLARIWAVNQPDYAGDFVVDFSQSQPVLIHRRGECVAVDELTPVAFTVLQSLAAGASLAQAVEAADAAERAHADADSAVAAALPELLATGLRHGLIRGVYSAVLCSSAPSHSG